MKKDFFPAIAFYWIEVRIDEYIGLKGSVNRPLPEWFWEFRRAKPIIVGLAEHFVSNAPLSQHQHDMIPAFTSEGVLPPGIHRTTQAEFEQRFVSFNHSDRRYRFYEGLKRLIDDARRSGIVRRLIIVGSYITAKAEPNDFDCVMAIDPRAVDSRMPPYQYNLLSKQRCRAPRPSHQIAGEL